MLGNCEICSTGQILSVLHLLKKAFSSDVMCLVRITTLLSQFFFKSCEIINYCPYRKISDVFSVKCEVEK